MSDPDEETPTGNYTIEDVLNDTSDFELDLPGLGLEKAEKDDTKEGTFPSVPASSNGTHDLSSASESGSKSNGRSDASEHVPSERPTTPIAVKSVAVTLEDAMKETEDLELGSTSNINIDNLVKSIITDKNEGIKDVKLMTKVKEYEQSLMNVDDSKRLLKTLEERRRRQELNSSILETIKLEKIASQMSSAQFKKSSGTATCIAASPKLLAIGTSHGLTMIFDHFQTLKLVIGNTDGVEYGRVYSVALSPDSEWLVAGHHLGQIVVWDLVAMKPVKVLANDPPLTLDGRGQVPVIFVDFVEGKRTKFIALSLDGVLNIHNLTRVFLVTMLDTNYILSGSSGAGSVLAVSVLPPGVGKTHPVDAFCLIACATFKRVVVFPASDKSCVIYHSKRPETGREGALPYLAWRELVSTSKSGKMKILDPVLAIGWGNTIVLVQIIQTLVDVNGIATDPTEVSSLVFRRIASFNTDTEITSIHWLGTGVLVYTNTADELRVMDPFSVEEIEIDHIKHMELAYHTKFAGLRQIPGASSATKESLSSPGPSAKRGQLPSMEPSAPSSGQSRAQMPSPVPPKHRRAARIPQEIIDQQRAHIAPKTPAITDRDQTYSQSFHASICCMRGKLFMIGMKAAYVTVVLGWAERINVIVEKGKWLDALALALDFWYGRAKAVKGLPRDPVRAAAKIGARIEQLLYDYVKVNLAIPIPKDPAHFDVVATVCIDYCLILGRLDILFQLLHPLFHQRKKGGLLLEKLEPFILGDKMTQLPPEIIQQLVKHYVSQPHLIPKLEQLLLHIDLGLLDFHSVVNLCIKHHLSTALFHLYIDGLGDYITPMEHLMKVLVKDVDLSNQFTTPEMRELKTAIGLKIIYYLSYIFRGKSFPSETRLPAQKVEELREAIFFYLLVPKLPGADPNLAGEKYPRLRVLLAADSHELLNVLRIALDGISNPTRLVQTTDILVSLMVDPAQAAGKSHALFWSDKPNPSWPFTPSQVAELYYFIAHYYSTGALDISDDILQRITGYALLSSDSQHDKREKLLLDILRACPEEKLDYSKLALLAESAKFYKVCDFFFTHRRDYGAVIRCHILDPDYRKSIFSFVKTLMTSTDPSNPKIMPKTNPSTASSPAPPPVESDPRFVAYMLTDKEKEDVKKTCIERITDLIRIDNERTANLVINVLRCDQTQIIQLLNPYPEVQLAYLKACLQLGLDARSSSSAANENANGSTASTPTKRRPASKRMEPPRPVSGFDAKRPPLDMVAGEKLLELLCRFEPHVVVNWIKENESVYRLDAAIEITKHFGIWAAYCTLQETAGDMSEVLRVLSEPISQNLIRLYERSRNTKAVPPFGTNGVLETQEEEELIQEHIDAAIAFCKRNHKRMEASESQETWFKLLDKIMYPLGEVEAYISNQSASAASSNNGASVKQIKIVQSASSKYFENRPSADLELLKYHLNKLMSRILDSMIGFVDLQAILEKILNERVDSKVSDFRDIFVRLLENYTHECNILGAAVKVLRYDTYQQFAHLVKSKQRGMSGRHLTIENTPATEPQSRVLEGSPLFQDEPSRLQLLRDIDTGAIRKSSHSSEQHHMRRDDLASMRNIQLQKTVPGAMPAYSMFHSVVKLDDP